MKKILIVTVGGSHQPILESLKQNPDFTYFLCSSDSGKAKGSYNQVIGKDKVLKSSNALSSPDLPNIATLGKLAPEQFFIHNIQHFDDLNDCYTVSLGIIKEAHQRFPEAKVLVDYTGGTKSMTAGLVLAAIDDRQCELRLVVGERANLEKVKDTTQFVCPVQVLDIQVARQMTKAGELIRRFDYSGAERLLTETAESFASERTIAQLRCRINLCRAFDAWDRFDHKQAYELLKLYRDSFKVHYAFLSMLVGKQGHGFELIEDLLLNAERRAVQQRYDDAVGRLYRALELTAQVYLQGHYSIDTGNVDINRVPEKIRDTIEKRRDASGRIEIPLKLAWDVIAEFPDEPLSNHYSANKNALLSFLKVRNNSLFAHGEDPITAGIYERFAPAAEVFIKKAVALALKNMGRQRRVEPAQLPRDFTGISSGDAG